MRGNLAGIGTVSTIGALVACACLAIDMSGVIDGYTLSGTAIVAPFRRTFVDPPRPGIHQNPTTT